MQKASQSLEVSRSVHCLWREPDVHQQYSTAVSLHSHTMHSREGLDFVRRMLRRVPVAYAALEIAEGPHRRKLGKPVPFERAFWRPPLHPHAAFDLECAQIQETLGLRPLVSITDHDSQEACAELHAIGIAVPYSVEWSVPYQGTMFHLGVHNLPEDHARGLGAAMAIATADPTRERIAELLAAMHGMEDVLLVLNHPFVCEGRVDDVEHRRLLDQFLGEFGQWLHALELNGLQSAASNAQTIRLAAERGMPVISGGDRHCTEPNANLNLTDARTFCDFVHEIRHEQRSRVLFLPQYRDPISARYIEFIWQAVRDYPDFTGRERWVDRIFFQRESGETVALRSEWPKGGPAVIRGFISVAGILASPGVRAVHRITLGRVANLEPEIL